MLESLKHEDLQFQELSPEEKQSRGILARLSGPIASFTKGTRNGRKYSDKLWEKAFDSPLVKEMFNNGGLPGELQHPENRSETDPTKIAIMMPEPPKKDSNGHLVASVDILDTPCGQIAYQLGKYGFKFGISSRGEGDLITDFSGEESVDPDTYTLNAFDLVLIPACEDARLQFNEGLERKSSTNNLRSILSEALEKASDKDRKIMEDAIDELDFSNVYEYVETYEDNDIFYDPDTKKYIVGDTDSYTTLNSLKNAKEYIDRYNPEGEFFKEGLLKEEQVGREETKESDIPSNLLQNKPQYDQNIQNIYLQDEEDAELLDEGLTPQEKMDAWHEGNRRENIKACGDRKLAAYIKICKNSGYDKEANIIRQEFERRGIPKELYEDIEEDNKENKESWNTDFHRLDVAYNHNFKQFEDMEEDKDALNDFIEDLDNQHKKYTVYKHEKDPGCTVFFKESLNESCDGWIAFYNGKKLEITKDEATSLYDAKQKAVKELKVPKSKMGLFTIKPAYNESLNEDALDDSGVSIAPVYVIANMRSKDKFNLENGNLIQGKDLLDYFDPYDKLKIASSPGEIDKIVDVITESLNEDISWEELNGTEQSAVEMALAAIKHGSTIEDAVHGAVEDCNWGNIEPEYEDEDFFGEEANYTKVLDYVKSHEGLNESFGKDYSDINEDLNEESVRLAADDNGAIVEQLQNILKQNKSLEEKVKGLQEKLSVGYAKEMELKEELDTYKQRVSKLSNKTKEIKVLTEKLSKAEKKIKDNKAQAEGKISTLNESISSKEFENKDLRKDISVLTETLGKKDSLIKSLDEQLGKAKDKLSSKQDDIEQLKEQYETGQKDLEQLKTQYAKKIEQQNQIIEKYQRVAKNSVKRYIESQAVRLGVKSDEIVNRLPKNYSFNDIDTICEDLQEYKFNISNLPFNPQGLNEGLRVTAKNISKGLIEANPDDEITEYDLKIAEAYI